MQATLGRALSFLGRVLQLLGVIMMAPAIIFFILLLVAFQYGPIPADPGPFWGPIILIMFVSSVLGLMVFAVGSLVSPYERRLKGEVDERQWPSEKTRSRIEKWLDEWL